MAVARRTPIGYFRSAICRPAFKSCWDLVEESAQRLQHLELALVDAEAQSHQLGAQLEQTLARAEQAERQLDITERQAGDLGNALAASQADLQGLTQVIGDLPRRYGNTPSKSGSNSRR